MSYDPPAPPQRMSNPDQPGGGAYPSDGVDKKRLAAAGNSWQRLRSATVENGITGAPSNSYRPDQIQYFDYNFYSTKKLVSSTLLDVALLMANVSQLKAVYLMGKAQPFYVVLLALLIISIILQLISGLLLIWLGRININEPDEAKHKQATILSNAIVVMVFILTVVNIIVSSLGISNDLPFVNNYVGVNDTK